MGSELALSGVNRIAPFYFPRDLVESRIFRCGFVQGVSPVFLLLPSPSPTATSNSFSSPFLPLLSGASSLEPSSSFSLISPSSSSSSILRTENFEAEM
ncbi:hypothetical protein YC2023_037533 [Brassica napus]